MDRWTRATKKLNLFLLKVYASNRHRRLPPHFSVHLWLLWLGTATFSSKCPSRVTGPLKIAAPRRDKVNRVCRRTCSRSTEKSLIRHQFECDVPPRFSPLTVANYSKACVSTRYLEIVASGSSQSSSMTEKTTLLRKTRAKKVTCSQCPLCVICRARNENNRLFFFTWNLIFKISNDIWI